MTKSNFSYLLGALLIFIIVLPVGYDLGLIPLHITRFLAVSSLLAVGIWSLRGTGRLYTIGMLAVVVGIVLSVVSVIRSNNSLLFMAEISLLVFLLLATYNALRQIAAGHDFSPNRIIGAICVYLMLGVIWSIAYFGLEFMRPGSFSGLTEGVALNLSTDWTYFSFVTITTLGYGDILPLTQSARALAFTEAIVGQLYIAILVAGLVGAYISAQGNGGDQD